ncbi:MAG: hypothetical protein PHO02_00040 [Candidatus Nanoarchaeia archaeon]|nr:hypothetical protein [Candidatus Nanoarchaeia archaeon]
MISRFEEINRLFEELDSALNRKISMFMIGGGVLLFYGLKPATKDIDIVVNTNEEFLECEKALKKMGFQTKLPDSDYKHFNLSQIFTRNDFRIDLFNKTVCKGFSLSSSMAKRALKEVSLANITLSLCSLEDIFLFKTMTEREGDLSDCIALAKIGINWESILEELKQQIKQSGNNIWITWVAERLEILQERGIVMPIMAKIAELVEKYYSDLEHKKQN